MMCFFDVLIIGVRFGNVGIVRFCCEDVDLLFLVVGFVYIY